jgi:hypothetical protein
VAKYLPKVSANQLEVGQRFQDFDDWGCLCFLGLIIWLQGRGRMK